WDVYQLIPMLMALGIAVVTTFLAMRTWRLLGVENLSFYRFNLKSSGVMRKAGWAFLSFALLWLGLNIHSGWIRYHESAGARAFESIRIPDELALAQTNPARWLSATDRENIAAGEKHFYTAFDTGLFLNKPALSKLAWIEYLSGDTEQAVRLLDRAVEHQEGESKVLSLYYRGAILNRLGRYEQGLASLEQALAERPDLIAAHEEKGESLWQLGRRQEAVSAWNEAVRRNANLTLANNLLAGAAASMGQHEAAAAYEKQAEQSTPADPLFYWIVGLRLENAGMNELAEKHFQRAIQLNPEFKRARRN
ncbi:MAG: tetratricopeptide repeat protein, partial [Acidobacteriota bacterium]|nr:tetratricopeptide repeat protein [Acidobacteriota bacterium]